MKRRIVFNVEINSRFSYGVLDNGLLTCLDQELERYIVGTFLKKLTKDGDTDHLLPLLRGEIEVLNSGVMHVSLFGQRIGRLDMNGYGVHQRHET